MCKSILAMSCLACIAFACRARGDSLHRQGDAKRKCNPADALSTFLLALAPASAFQPLSARPCQRGRSTPSDELTHQGPQRRELLRSAWAALLALPACSAAAAVRGGVTGAVDGQLCKTESDPFKTMVTCINYGLDDGGLRGCNSDEACVASQTGASNSKYAFPWTSSTSDLSRTWTSVVAAVEDQPDLTIVDKLDDKFYLRATAKSKFPTGGTDDVEFLVTASNNSKPLVFFRSSTRQTIYVYPLTQPVSNQQSHVDRLKEIRSRLAWGEESNQAIADYGALERKSNTYAPENIFGLRLEGGIIDEDDDAELRDAFRKPKKSKKSAS